MGNNKDKNSTGSLTSKVISHIIALKEKKKKINKFLSGNKLARREANKFQNSLEGMTKEEKIAANKAGVAKYHPEPDVNTSSKTIYQSRKKIEFEKGMKEKAKKVWCSIVSVPMGGMNKKK